jgi:hypothetical protein
MQPVDWRGRPDAVETRLPFDVFISVRMFSPATVLHALTHRLQPTHFERSRRREWDEVSNAGEILTAKWRRCGERQTSISEVTSERKI